MLNFIIYLEIQNNVGNFEYHLKQTTMNTENILRKVPTPETCQKLNWQNDTLFYWRAYNTLKGTQYALYIKILHWYYLVFEDFDSKLCKPIGTYIPAPQVDDIASVIPEKWNLDSWSTELYYQDYKGDEPVFNSRVKNHHYAQAYAELYLKLKEKGLL